MTSTRRRRRPPRSSRRARRSAATRPRCAAPSRPSCSWRTTPARSRSCARTRQPGVRSSGRPSELVDTMGQYRDLGFDEFIVPEWNFGRRPRRTPRQARPVPYRGRQPHRSVRHAVRRAIGRIASAMNRQRIEAVALGLIAVFMLPAGVQATFAPRSFFDDFPLGRGWISHTGDAYNEHLVRDVGALFLAMIIVTVWTVWRHLPATTCRRGVARARHAPPRLPRGTPRRLRHASTRSV